MSEVLSWHESQPGDGAVTGDPLDFNTAKRQGASSPHKAIKIIGADVEETACKKGPILCPFYEMCGYQAQKEPTKAADVVFAAHEIGFHSPDILGDGFGLVVIDEAFWQDGITDARIAISGLDLELEAFPVLNNGGKKNADDTAHLKDQIERLQRVLNASPDGYVTKEGLFRCGIAA